MLTDLILSDVLSKSHVLRHFVAHVNFRDDDSSTDDYSDTFEIKSA